MIIRPLREDEGAKLSAIQSIAFNFSADLETADKVTSEVIGAFLDDNETLTSTIYPNSYQSNYCGTYLPCVGIGGVATLPEHRRAGGIRAIFDEIFRLAPERGWATSYLYPFSYEYYRQFGYERVMERSHFRFSSAALKHFPRDPGCVLYQGQPQVLADIREIYRTFAAEFNIIFERGDSFPHVSAKPHKDTNYTYVHYSGGGKIADAYAILHKNNDTLEVRELLYTGKPGLLGILGFLRMFEGQADNFAIIDQPADSELAYLFSDYIDVSRNVSSAGMARVLLPEILLNQNSYPETPGAFRLKVNDSLPYSCGIYEVTYANGRANVIKRTDGDYDIACEIPALTRILLGEDSFTLSRISYLPGVEIQNAVAAQHFLRAFPKRRMCLYNFF